MSTVPPDTIPAGAKAGAPQLPDPVMDVKQADTLANCSTAKIRRALHTTDIRAYPPPLKAAGRHGYGGKFLIQMSELNRWLEELGRFE